MSKDNVSSDHAGDVPEPDASTAIVDALNKGIIGQRHLGPQRAWEIGTTVYDSSHTWPFTRVAEFALGITVLTIRADQQAVAAAGGQPAPQDIPRPVVMLVALALYEAARRERLTKIIHLPLRRALPLLSTDAAARELARIRPAGSANSTAGHMPEDDARDLTEVLLPQHAAQWESWRAQAEHALMTMYEHHGGLEAAPTSSMPMLSNLLSDCRAVGVRARWIERPDVSPLGVYEPSDADEWI
ncbi:hypothetical protein [Lentzea sp. NBRC 105346]|uniref:hypothetical protein n=1 Tax=Lentzea sp. NBRC 105346 TaxID=3032205 RepID=UPI0025564CE7|nr:hypothetical protein [Lentzea sp. NBRC 105346]